jgi:hypothetical protein
LDTGSVAGGDSILFLTERIRVSDTASFGRDVTQASNPGYSFFKQDPDSMIAVVKAANTAMESEAGTEAIDNTVLQVSIWKNETGDPANYLGESLNESVRVTIENVNHSESSKTLKVVKMDTDSEEWRVIDPEPTVTGSPGNYSVTFTVTPEIGFSVFEVISSGVQTDGKASEVIVYPNPYIPHDGNNATGQFCRGSCADGEGIHFGAGDNRGFAVNSRVKIYNVAGELIDDFRSTEGGIIQWDAHTRNGDPVASGVYFYIIEIPSGGRETGKLSVIR